MAELTKEEQCAIERAKLLFDYTKFHIGLYATLAAVLVSVLGSKYAEEWALCKPLVLLAVIAIVIAGAAGGMVASSLPLHIGDTNFLDKHVAPAWAGSVGEDQPDGRAKTIKEWTHVEHAAFWLAVIVIVITFAVAAYSDKKAAAGERRYTLTVEGCTSAKVQ